MLPKVHKMACLISTLFVLLSQSLPVTRADDFKLLEVTPLQEQGIWFVTFKVQYIGGRYTVINPESINASIEGWVSNSEVPRHSQALWSSMKITGLDSSQEIPERKFCPTGLTQLIVESGWDECQEYGLLQLWSNDSSAPALPKSAGTAFKDRMEAPPQESLGLKPYDVFFVRLCLQHLHRTYGPYHPLLGDRTIKLQAGGQWLATHCSLSQARPVLPPARLKEPPAEKRGAEHFISAPESSLYLGAHLPGTPSYDFEELQTKHDTKMRLRFWYLLAPGSEGEGKVTLIELGEDIDATHATISEGGMEITLKRMGRWTRVERIFKTENKTVAMTLKFRLCCPTGVGEIWLDDISLEPVQQIPGP